MLSVLINTNTRLAEQEAKAISQKELQLFNKLSQGFFSPVNFIGSTIHNSNEIQMRIQLGVLIAPLPVAVLDSLAWRNAEENCISLSFKGKKLNL